MTSPTYGSEHELQHRRQRRYGALRRYECLASQPRGQQDDDAIVVQRKRLVDASGGDFSPCIPPTKVNHSGTNRREPKSTQYADRRDDKSLRLLGFVPGIVHLGSEDERRKAALRLQPQVAAIEPQRHHRPTSREAVEPVARSPAVDVVVHAHLHALD